MVLGKIPPFTEHCAHECGARIVLTAPTFDLARGEILAAGWVERHRKGGARRSQWACPKCGAPKGAGVPIVATTTHGVVNGSK